MTYRDVAEHIGMTESGVKKIFSSRDCSYNRLSAIAQAAGLNMSEVLELNNPSEIQLRQFSKEEEAYFLKYMQCFYLYWLLTYDELDLEEAKDRLGLNQNELYRYLKKLDQFGFIRWKTNNSIEVQKTYYIWKDHGPLVEKIKNEWSRSVLSKTLKSSDPGDHFTLRYLRLRDESYQEFIRAINDVIGEFEKRALRERLNYESSDIEPHRVLFTSAQGSFV